MDIKEMKITGFKVGAFYGYDVHTFPRRLLCLLVCIARGFGLRAEAVASSDHGFGIHTVEQLEYNFSWCGACWLSWDLQLQMQVVLWIRLLSHLRLLSEPLHFSVCQPKLKLVCALCLWRFKYRGSWQLPGTRDAWGNIKRRTVGTDSFPQDGLWQRNRSLLLYADSPAGRSLEYPCNFLLSICQWKGVYWW